MRLSYALLATIIAVTFPSSGNAVATTDGGTMDLSAMTSPNAVASIDAAVGGGKRSLRYHNNKDLEDESDDEALLEEEERKYTDMFSTTKLDEMLNGTKMMSRFKKWKEKGYNTYNLPADTQGDKYTWIRQKYRDYLYHN